MRGLSPVAASGDHSSLRCAGLSPSQPLLLRSTGSRRAGSAIVAHGRNCSAAYGIFPDRGTNPCPLHWQADSQPLHHQGSPVGLFLSNFFLIVCILLILWAPNKNFTMLYPRYLCILINILELCFRRQLNYLETVSDFYGLFLNFVTWYQSSLESRTYFSPQLRQYPSEYPTQCPMNYEVFPLCLLRTSKCSQLCLRIGHYYLQCF